MKRKLILISLLFLTIYLLGLIFILFYKDKLLVKTSSVIPSEVSETYVYPFHKGNIKETIQLSGKYINNGITTQSVYSNNGLLVNLMDNVLVGESLTESVASYYSGTIVSIELISNNNYLVSLYQFNTGSIEFMVSKNSINPQVFVNMELTIQISQSSYITYISSIEEESNYYLVKTNDITLQYFQESGVNVIIVISLMTHYDVLYINLKYLNKISQHQAIISVVRNKNLISLIVEYYKINNEYAIITSNNVTIYDKIIS